MARPPVTLAEMGAGNASSWNETGRIAFGEERAFYVVSENGGQPERITDPSEPAWDPKWLPGGTSMLLVSDRGIEALDLATRARTFLLEGDSPRYAPSGHIVFARDTTLWAVPFDADALELAGEPVPILEGVARNTQYSRYALDETGTLAFLPADAVVQRSLIWVDAEGQSRPIEGLPPDDYRSPRLSPDGSKVALRVGPQIWFADPDRGTRRQLTFEGVQGYPGWSLDGAAVLYSSQTEAGWGLLSQPERAAAAETVFVGENLRAWDISSDGELFVFNGAFRGADLRLWSESSGVSTIEQTPTFEGSPRVDPTGRYVAYASNATGRLGERRSHPLLSKHVRDVGGANRVGAGARARRAGAPVRCTLWRHSQHPDQLDCEL